jgi:hypothetical protein
MRLEEVVEKYIHTSFTAIQQILLAKEVIARDGENEECREIIARGEAKLEIISFEIVGHINSFEAFRGVLYKQLEIIRELHISSALREGGKFLEMTENFIREMKMIMGRIASSK